MIYRMEEEPDVSVRDRFQKAIYLVGDEMHGKIVVPIAKIYPDLHPDDQQRFLNLPDGQQEP